MAKMRLLMTSSRRIVVTGANGFIGKNLCVRLRELGYSDVRRVTRETSDIELASYLESADFVFHLAGTNRPPTEAEFEQSNTGFTRKLSAQLGSASHRPVVVYASSVHATRDTPYGRSKRAAEEILLGNAQQFDTQVHILRLPNVFGKWSRPEYNSVVATFCHRLTRDLPISINDGPLTLIYIDDVLDLFERALDGSLSRSSAYPEISPTYHTTVAEVAETLRGFREGRRNLMAPRSGAGLVRALYATFVSFLPPESFFYDLPRHSDARGDFVEFLKTTDFGQVSYLTARPGVTRGEHYHHTKTERFLVVRGTARFGFRNIDTGEVVEVTTRGEDVRVVETIPGWAHNITNVGDGDLFVLLWASENFDRSRPDTIRAEV